MYNGKVGKEVDLHITHPSYHGSSFENFSIFCIRVTFIKAKTKLIKSVICMHLKFKKKNLLSLFLG